MPAMETLHAVLTGNTASYRTSIAWPALLPADDVTGWLSVHLSRRELIIDPSAAYPD
jgi:hypothetical protein